MSVDTDQVEQAARQLIDGRIEAVRTLAAARQTTEQAQQALADAERAGWTSAELRRVGFTPPRKAPGRPRSSRTRSPQTPENTSTD